VFRLEYRDLGKSGIKVSVVGLGCWPMGGEAWGGADDDESIRTIHKALDLGVTLFDTAEAYGRGRSEEVLGRGLVGKRNAAIVSSKAAAHNLAPADIVAALDGSLKRLQTEYLDVYFVHWPVAEIPLSETIGKLEDLRREGKIRAIGVSNFRVDQLEEARKHGQIDVVQPPYSLLWRALEVDLRPFCEANGIGIMTYSSLAQGLLTGTITKDTKFPEGDQRPKTTLFHPDVLAPGLEAVEGMKPIAREHKVSLAQLALNWVITRPGVTTSLVGARTAQEIEDNVGAVGWKLDVASDAALDKLTQPVLEAIGKYATMFTTLGIPTLKGNTFTLKRD
jgi:myo-inositol catabolism protein IolS